jgi:hypothetical protein
VPEQARHKQQGTEQTGNEFESWNDSIRGGEKDHARSVERLGSGTRVRPGIISNRVGEHGLGACARDRLVLFLAENGRLDGKMTIEEILIPRIAGSTGVSHRCIFRAPIIPQGLIETDDKPRQGWGIAEGVPAQEPGHAAFASTEFVAAIGPEVENGNTQIGVAFHRNQNRVAGICLQSVSKRREPPEG